jgi:hypothetical protein
VTTSAPADISTVATPEKGNPVAILSLICGLISCVPFVSVLAIVFGIIGVRKTKKPHVGGKGSAITGIALGSIGLLTNVPVIYVCVMMNHTADRIRCASNFSQVGQAILAYSNDNRGRYPPDLAALVKAQNISVADFLCPSMPGGSSLPSNLEQMSIDQKADWVKQHADVVYLGACLRLDAPPETIVLYEKHDERNSPPDGSFNTYEVQMLFANGHVEPIPSAEAHRRIEGQLAR